LYNGNSVVRPFTFLVVPAEGRYGTVGEEFRLPIQVTNFQPKHLSFKVIHKDSKRVYENAKIQDSTLSDAKHDIVFTPNFAGKHLIEMTLQGKTVPGTPLEMDVVSPPLVTLLTPGDETYSVDSGTSLLLREYLSHLLLILAHSMYQFQRKMVKQSEGHK